MDDLGCILREGGGGERFREGLIIAGYCIE